ncbi:MAG TPA: hypothetical protein PKE30_03865 [Niabella sp.]|nr:hypothetical protein [Niabella sp.]
MTDKECLKRLRTPEKDNLLGLLMSACLSDITCGWDGTAKGELRFT